MWFVRVIDRVCQSWIRTEELLAPLVQITSSDICSYDDLCQSKEQREHLYFPLKKVGGKNTLCVKRWNGINWSSRLLLERAE